MRCIVHKWLAWLQPAQPVVTVWTGWWLSFCFPGYCSSVKGQEHYFCNKNRALASCWQQLLSHFDMHVNVELKSRALMGSHYCARGFFVLIWGLITYSITKALCRCSPTTLSRLHPWKKKKKKNKLFFIIILISNTMDTLTQNSHFWP